MNKDTKAAVAKLLARVRSFCAKAHHDLSDLFEFDTGSDGEVAIVRQCRICGGVVIDREVEDHPMGQYMEMNFAEVSDLLGAFLEEEAATPAKT